jgi:hypothetical protein
VLFLLKMIKFLVVIVKLIDLDLHDIALIVEHALMN